MIPLSVLLKHYKRKEIQEEIALHAKDKEVAVRFNDKFGKRPDVVSYPRDILEFAKQGATSFHSSEERWRNPLSLDPSMKKRDLDDLRIGWDLVLDIDCPFWEYSKLITHLMIQALKKNGVKSISCKFSGNKGFHIGVPFEAFPKQILGTQETRLWFPDGAKTIAMYLTYYIDSKETNFELTKKILNGKTIEGIADELKIPYTDLVKKVCSKCGTEATKNKEKLQHRCLYCNDLNEISKGKSFFQCKKCKKLVKIDSFKEHSCSKCKNTKFVEKFDISNILDVDTLLISSRHLYRMPYSLHEKSGLCSIPVDLNQVLNFDRETAKPELVSASPLRFLDKENVPNGNAIQLFDEARQWFLKKNEINDLKEKYSLDTKKEYEGPSEAIPEQFFPPCIKSILSGLPDGRKRALFVLVNFLSKVGWEPDQIEEKLKQWNKNNEEQLREVYLVGQLRYYKQRKQSILPPNCDNSSYYHDLRVCNPDNLCKMLKNPVSYSTRKVKHLGSNKKKKKEVKKETKDGTKNKIKKEVKISKPVKQETTK